MKHILLFSQDQKWLEYLTLLLKEPNLTTHSEASLAGAEKRLRITPVDCVVTDEDTFIELAKGVDPTMPIIVFFDEKHHTREGLVRRGAVVALEKSEAYLLPLILIKLLA